MFNGMNSMNGFEIFISSDGKAASGKTIKDEGIILPLPSEASGREEEIRKLEREARAYDRELQKEFSKIKELEAELVELKAKQNELRETACHQSKAIPKWCIVLGVVGFVSGIILAIQELLEHHGPTVTALGTLGACCIYLLAGILFACFFAYIGKLQAEGDILPKDVKEMMAEKKAAVSRLEAELATRHKVSEALAKEARQARFRAWGKGGII